MGTVADGQPGARQTTEAMSMKALPLVLAAVLVASICPGRSGPPEPIDTVAPVSDGARVYYDDGPAFTDSVRLVVRDGRVVQSLGLRRNLRTWQDVWVQATSTRQMRPAPPRIEFDNVMLLVVAAGRMRAGDRIYVDSAGVRGNQFVAVVRTVEECQPFPAPAYPLEIIKVQREELEVRWEERRQKAAHCM